MTHTGPNHPTVIVQVPQLCVFCDLDVRGKGGVGGNQRDGQTSKNAYQAGVPKKKEVVPTGCTQKNKEGILTRRVKQTGENRTQKKKLRENFEKIPTWQTLVNKVNEWGWGNKKRPQNKTPKNRTLQGTASK